MLYTPSRHAPVHAPSAMRLQLTAPVDANCYYGSAWNDGAVVISSEMSGHTMAYSRQFPWIDGCTWRADEKLVPVGPAGSGRYTYEYTETILSCPAGAVPAEMCPRQGVVFAEPLAASGPVAPTPSFAVSSQIPDLSPWFGSADVDTSEGCPAMADEDDDSADSDSDSVATAVSL